MIKHKSNFPKTFSLCLGVLIMIFVLNYLVLAWTEPSQSPPDGNVSAPLNVGNTGQSKAGGLILNTGGAVTGLVVDKGNVGIGMSNPSNRLEVSGKIYSSDDILSAGNINAAGDVCNGAGACLSKLNDFIGSTALVNNQHTYKACTDAGGQVVDSDVSFKQCRFGTPQCPTSGNWTQYKLYSKTVSVQSCGGSGYCSHRGYCICASPVPCCDTGGHSFSNVSVESCCAQCGWINCYAGCGGRDCPALTVYAQVEQIGCY